MTPDSSSNELMRILNFDTDDLRQNQKGQMSLQQRLDLLMKIDFIPVFLFLAAPVGGVVALINGQPLLELAPVPIVMLLAGFLSRTSWKIFQSVIRGQVATATGTIEIRVYRHDRRTFLGMMGEQYANGIIGDAVFLVPVELATFFQGKPLRVFYSQPYYQALSAELLIE